MEARSFYNYVSSPLLPGSEPEPLYKMLKGEDLVQVHSHSINLIIGRDLRQNVRYSCAMGVQLASEGKRVLYLNSYARPELLKSCLLSAKAPAGDLPLTIADVPLGEYQHKDVSEFVESGRMDVVILNSLEFAGLTREQRHRVCREMVKLQKAFNISLVVFSHEIKRDLAPGCASRGAIGLLSPLAESISKIGDGWVRFEEARLPMSPLMMEHADRASS